MEFDHQAVCAQVEKFAQELGLPEDQSLPVPLLVEIHGQQDYAIAYFCNLIDTPLSWEIQVCTIFADSQGEIYEHDYAVILPGMKNSEMMLGAPWHMMKRKSGFKSQWKGILKELENAYEDDKKITKDHTAIKTLFYIQTEAHFLNEYAYDHFHELIQHRESGNLIRKLEAMERQIFKDQLLVTDGV